MHPLLFYPNIWIGLRDPYEIIGAGAGFLFSWQGNTKLLIGRQNDDGELVQVISDSMLIAIPKYVVVNMKCFGN